ncbi:unnamed protein product [Merluccius merluccius]
MGPGCRASGGEGLVAASRGPRVAGRRVSGAIMSGVDAGSGDGRIGFKHLQVATDPWGRESRMASLASQKRPCEQRRHGGGGDGGDGGGGGGSLLSSFSPLRCHSFRGS